jgi:exosome complex RNA-binding protein Rrp4
VHPGTKLSRYKDEHLGYGLYCKDNTVYASVLGHIVVLKINSQNVYSVANHLPNKRVGLRVGDAVYARVLRIKEE